jgi:electron transfer flavoprotein alpha/beta subunit
MDLLVCCKIVPDLDLLSDHDWVIPAHGRIDTAFVRTMINPFDESALELALRLADCAGPEVRLSALTIGSRQADPVLKTLLALRFDRVVRMEPAADLVFCPEVVAALIAAYARSHPQDALLMGRQSGEGDHGKTPLLVAEHLGWPCVSEVTRVEAAAGRLRITSQVDDGLLEQTLRPPCVLSVGNVAGTALRVPTLKARMQHGQRAIERIEPGPELAEALQCWHRDYALEGLARISHARAGTILEGTDPAALARTLYEDHLRARMAAL